MAVEKEETTITLRIPNVTITPTSGAPSVAESLIQQHSMHGSSEGPITISKCSRRVLLSTNSMTMMHLYQPEFNAFSMAYTLIRKSFNSTEQRVLR